MDRHAVDPTTYENAIIEAERDCHKVITKALGLEIGVNSFTGIKGEKAVESVVFDIGRPETQELAGFPSTCYHFRGQLDMYSRNREQLQKWEMRLLYLFPIQTAQATTNLMPANSNVEQFRLAPATEYLNDITTVEIPIGKLSDDKKVEVFTTSAFFDIVFNAGTRPA